MHLNATLKGIHVDSGEELGRDFLLAFAMLLMVRRIVPGRTLALEIMGKSGPYLPEGVPYGILVMALATSMGRSDSRIVAPSATMAR